MFSSEAESAILDLQRRASKSSDNYTLECIERALDEIVRNPHKTDPDQHQVRSAMANAAKVIKNRRLLAPTTSVDDPSIGPGYLEPGYAAVEMASWLDSAPLSTSDRATLSRLADGAEADTL